MFHDPPWNDAHAASKLPHAFPGRLNGSPAGTVGARGHQRHSQPTAQADRVGMRIHPQSNPSGLARLPARSQQQRGQSCGRRHKPGVATRPTAYAPRILGLREWSMKRGQALGPVGDHDHPFMGRPALDRTQPAQPAQARRVAAETENGARRIRDHAALPEVCAQCPRGVGRSVHGFEYTPRVWAVRIGP